MPEYVYALYDFLPEHEDEVDFLAGERIEVVERDDQFGDGWWQVCSKAPIYNNRIADRLVHRVVTWQGKSEFSLWTTLHQPLLL